jgi:hypothetical protein
MGYPIVMDGFQPLIIAEKMRAALACNCVPCVKSERHPLVYGVRADGLLSMILEKQGIRANGS